MSDSWWKRKGGSKPKACDCVDEKGLRKRKKSDPEDIAFGGNVAEVKTRSSKEGEKRKK